MQHSVNGKIVALTPKANGCVSSDEIRRVAGIPGDRVLIVHHLDGTKRVINPGEDVWLAPGDYISDIPPHRRGSEGMLELSPFHLSYPANLWDNVDQEDDDRGDDDDWDNEDEEDDDWDNENDDNNRDITAEEGDDSDDEDDEPYDNQTDLEQDIQQLSEYYELWLDDDYRFVVVMDVELPPGYNKDTTDLYLEIPADYPSSPPGIAGNRVYVSSELRFCGRALQDIHPNRTPKYEVHDFGPWAWFCYEWIQWDPCWDDLLNFIEMVRADLTSPRTL